MMIFQKQQHFPIPASPFVHHRKHSSASPAVVVQPTRTPGLLTITKQSRPSPQRPQYHNLRPKSTQRPKSAAAPVVSRSPQPVPALPVSVPDSTVPAESTDKKTDKPSPRGRQQTKPKDKSTPKTRSDSQSSPHGKRNHGRQPSPPFKQQQKSSQAEGPTTPTSSQTSNPDPFLDDSSRNKFLNANNLISPPSLSSRPTGKLARRRQQQTHTPLPSTPTPSNTKAIPVPKQRSQQQQHHHISRSAPAPSHIPVHHKRVSSSVPATINLDFPICDDMTEAGDFSDLDYRTPPATPTRSRVNHARYDNPLYSAPLSGFFLHDTSFPPVEKQVAHIKAHQRFPSDALFSMSSDEDSSTPDVVRTPNNKTKTAHIVHRRGSVGTMPQPGSALIQQPATVPRTRESREKQLEREAAAIAAGYFASSMFQNSPSPEELPPPLFV